MAQKTIRIGVIGLQFGARVHVPAFRGDSRCLVVALAGGDGKRAEEAARLVGIRGSFGDWRELVSSSQIDAVSLAVPPALQTEIAVEAAARRKHVFCEKPLSSNVVDAGKALQAVREAGIVHGVDFLFPEIAAWRRAQELLREGHLGALRHFSYTWKVETRPSRHCLESWKTSPNEGGGVMGNFISHVFYNIGWLMGPIAEVVSCRFLPGATPFCAVECGVRLESGASGNILVRTDAFLGCGHLVELHGDQGALVLHNPSSDYAAGFRLLAGGRSRPALVPVCSEDPVPGVDGRIAAAGRIAGRFLDAICTEGEVRPNFEDGVRVQHLLHKAALLAASSAHA